MFIKGVFIILQLHVLSLQYNSIVANTNVSRLLDNLLKNYTKSLRPTHDTGAPTIVDININIKSIGPISNFEMAYTMDCYFRQEWRDPRLAFEGPFDQIILSMKMLELIWKPDTFFLNGKECYLHKIPTSNRLVRLSRDGRVLYSSRLTIKASCPMQLMNFPLDKQVCPLFIGSFSYSSNEVIYRWKSKSHLADWKPIQIDDGVRLSQFDLLGTEWNSSEIVKNNKFIYEFIGMKIILKRHIGFYVLQVYVPCIMLVILSWVSFFINREATSDRSCIGIMCVLSLATLSFDVRNDIPAVPYVTALDWFLIMCYLFLFASLLQFTIVHYFTKVGYGDNYTVTQEEEDTRFDETRYIDKGSHLAGFYYEKVKSTKSWIVNYWFLFRMCITSDPKFKSHLTKSALERLNAKGINSVSRVDRLSRTIFPLFFFILNILYWLNYYQYD